jgi:hypothetical protein
MVRETRRLELIPNKKEKVRRPRTARIIRLQGGKGCVPTEEETNPRLDVAPLHENEGCRLPSGAAAAALDRKEQAQRGW